MTELKQQIQAWKQEQREKQRTQAIARQHARQNSQSEMEHENGDVESSVLETSIPANNDYEMDPLD